MPLDALVRDPGARRDPPERWFIFSRVRKAPHNDAFASLQVPPATRYQIRDGRHQVEPVFQINAEEVNELFKQRFWLVYFSHDGVR